MLSPSTTGLVPFQPGACCHTNNKQGAGTGPALGPLPQVPFLAVHHVWEFLLPANWRLTLSDARPSCGVRHATCESHSCVLWEFAAHPAVGFRRPHRGHVPTRFRRGSKVCVEFVAVSFQAKAPVGLARGHGFLNVLARGQNSSNNNVSNNGSNSNDNGSGKQ